MDFTGRSSQPSQPAQNTQVYSSQGAPAGGNKKSSNKKSKVSLMRWGAGVWGLLVVFLVVGVIVLIGVGGNKESNLVNKDKLQAVFLQTGQVYFGDIVSMNKQYLVLDNVYYLQTAGGQAEAAEAANNANVSLVKLGCELHAPTDRMVVNREQVTFWENLQDSGQVAKAVAAFVKENPNGQKCADTPSNANPTNVQGSTTNTTNQTNNTNSSNTRNTSED